ncbi:MAG TPA: hydroxyisourate hydrolase [Acidimicrobiia bacterium]
MTTLSTHVLDTASGEPARGMRVHLARFGEAGWEPVGELDTDDDGRITGFGDLAGGIYRLGFETGEWGNDFLPFVHVVFTVDEERPHHHIPLLLSPFGYTTYRGS